MAARQRSFGSGRTLVLRKAMEALLLLACAIQPSNAGTLSDQFIPYLQKRLLKWTSDVVSSDPQSLGASATVFFVGSDSPYTALVQLTGRFDRPKYADCHALAWLADGQSVLPSHVIHQALPRDDSPVVSEVLSSVLSIEQFRQLAAAKSLGYRVCGDEGVVPDEDVLGLRQMVGRLGD